MIYDINFDGIHKLIGKLNAATRPSVIKPALHDGALHLVEWIPQNRLSGPRPKYLQKVSGLLAGNIIAGPAELNGNEYTNKIGTWVPYARRHEYGFQGTETVRPHMRRVTAKVRLFGRTKRLTTGRVFTSVFQRKANTPARPFLWPSIQDSGNQHFVHDLLRQRIIEAIDKA